MVMEYLVLLMVPLLPIPALGRRLIQCHIICNAANTEHYQPQLCDELCEDQNEVLARREDSTLEELRVMVVAILVLVTLIFVFQVFWCYRRLCLSLSSFVRLWKAFVRSASSQKSTSSGDGREPHENKQNDPVAHIVCANLQDMGLASQWPRQGQRERKPSESTCPEDSVLDCSIETETGGYENLAMSNVTLARDSPTMNTLDTHLSNVTMNTTVA